MSLLPYLLPYQKWTMSTYLDPQTAERRLQENVEPPRWLRTIWNRNHKLFHGTAANGRFKIMRIIHYRNSFMPQISGEIRPGLGGTEITLKAVPHPLGYLAVAIILIAFTVNFGIMFSNGVTEEINIPFFSFFPIFIFVLVYGILIGSFQFELHKAKHLLRRIWPTEPTL